MHGPFAGKQPVHGYIRRRFDRTALLQPLHISGGAEHRDGMEAFTVINLEVTEGRFAETRGFFENCVKIPAANCRATN